MSPCKFLGASRLLFTFLCLTLFRAWLSALPSGGDDGNRTHDPLLAGQVLSQLSYTPIFLMRFLIEFPLWSLKIEQQVRSTDSCRALSRRLFWFWSTFKLQVVSSSAATTYVLHRKEVIQPHLPIRLPCYDLTPIIEPTFDCCLLAVSSQASGVPDFHGLTGGVYKARERIHRGMLIRDY